MDETDAALFKHTARQDGLSCQLVASYNSRKVKFLAEARNNMSNRKALVLDDHPMVAESVAAVIRSKDPLAVVEVAHSLKTALALKAKGRDFDLIVLDLSLPDTKGIGTFEAMATAWPAVPKIVFSGLSHSILIQQCLAQGAKAFVAKSDDVKSLYKALEANWPTLSRIEDFDPTARVASELTSKQIAIWQDLAAGYSNLEIAERHGIAINTVKSHVREILDRIQVRNRTEAARLFFEQQRAGLVG
jgi:DNA-binding NarL/FixJ family response regulator